MKKRLRVVQIGTAHDHAGDHIDTMRSLSDDYEIIGVCEPDDELRKKALNHISYDGSHRTIMVLNGLLLMRFSKWKA